MRTTTIFVCLKLIKPCLKFVGRNDTVRTPKCQCPTPLCMMIPSTSYHFNHPRCPDTNFHILALLCLSWLPLSHLLVVQPFCLYYCCSRILVLSFEITNSTNKNLNFGTNLVEPRHF